MSDFNKPNDKSRQDQQKHNPSQKPGQHNPDRSQSSHNSSTTNQKGKTEKTTW